MKRFFFQIFFDITISKTHCTQRDHCGENTKWSVSIQYNSLPVFHKSLNLFGVVYLNLLSQVKTLLQNHKMFIQMQSWSCSVTLECFKNHIYKAKNEWMDKRFLFLTYALTQIIYCSSLLPWHTVDVLCFDMDILCRSIYSNKSAFLFSKTKINRN